MEQLYGCNEGGQFRQICCQYADSGRRLYGRYAGHGFHGGICFFQSEMERTERLLCPDFNNHDAAGFCYSDPSVHDLEKPESGGYLLAVDSAVFFGGGAFNIFLLRQFFLGIPRELDEAARIDGAGPFQIFLRVILPLSKSALVVVALFTFLNNWNDFFGPIIYLNSKEHFTLAIGLLQFKGDYSTKWNLLMAASTIVVAPCVAIYLFGQKHLIEGISLTGLKA